MRRDDAARAAAKSMVNQLYAAGVDVNISISVFGSSAEGTSNGTLGLTSLQGAGGYATIMAALDKYVAPGSNSTNVKAGLEQAKGQLDASPAEVNVVMLLTDGAANAGGSGSASNRHHTAAVNAANDIKNSTTLNGHIFSIGFALGYNQSGNYSQNDYNAAYATLRDSSGAKEPMEGVTYCYTASSGNALASVMKLIGGIVESITPTGVSDPMGTGVIFDPINMPLPSGVSYESGTLNWAPSDMTQRSTYTYTVSLDVEANVGTADAPAALDLSQNIPLNGTTTFTYKLGEATHSADFLVPQGKGIAAKVFADGYLVNSTGQYLNVTTLEPTTDKAEAVLYTETPMNSAGGKNQWNFRTVESSEITAPTVTGYTLKEIATDSVTLTLANASGTFDILYVLNDDDGNFYNIT
ncbi:VWA domain-containing protein, partial [Ruminococcaceae bacterium OttesenSCG-928-O06]|nr:VWA domain-containing protein [Ruminococcaceae bacterium OttesenSCG-928-O06]